MQAADSLRSRLLQALCFGQKMRVSKLIISISIMVCMFLPLSQCSVGTVVEMESEGELIHKEQRSTSKTVIAVENAFQGEGGYWLVLTFLMPLIICAHIFRKREIRRWELALQTVLCGWLGFVIYSVVYSPFHTPLWGGYLLSIAFAAYLLVTILEWRKNITMLST
ncbi:hypothetical protein M5M_13962 [Simiduia agarivorans SA1 = DSM 21679]|uniref:Uncharacterized protein n=1 Tax=Simiduia agarivorans (strain DSM 21679 / JCM 13881 / BCRC 17597 / SA1) TaxID=1117647 RepID=R9S5F5_SIMAS|nr:hypothetical protein M5M_13962 [Simiduia agarivorans SA1 = DSM 21679]